MKIGIVCPYSFDVPGGVQFHIRDLTEELMLRGHQVSVLAPAEDDNLPQWLTSVGAAVPVRFNGSVARLSFGPIVSAKTRKWLDQGDFDVIHIHEPGSPSLGLLALIHAKNPVVATFHAALDRSILRQATSGLMQPFFEKIAARIAVSSEARRTLIEHHSGDAVVIPNGVFCNDFADARVIEELQGTDQSPVIVFLGRLDEPRKGLDVFLGAIPGVLETHPGARFLIAGRGHSDKLTATKEEYPQSIEILGEISDEDKQSLLKGATIYVAPQLGGESFGIVLVEAMAAGTTVVASDIAAFAAVLDMGRVGKLFRVGKSKDLQHKLNELLDDPTQNDTLAKAGQEWARQFDWSRVTEQILEVYHAVLPTTNPLRTGTAYEYLRSKLRRDV